MGVDTRRSSLREAVLGVLRSAEKLPDEGPCRSWEDGLSGILGDRDGGETAKGDPEAGERESRLTPSDDPFVVVGESLSCDPFRASWGVLREP